MTREPLEALMRRLPTRTLSAAEVETLVAGVEAGLVAARRARQRRRVALVSLAAAAAALLAWGTWSADTLPPDGTDAPVARGEADDPPAPDVADDIDDAVVAAEGSRYDIVGPADDRVVRLEAGRVRCEVEPRRDGGRFRVVVGDDEVEVTGTRFSVTADDGLLEGVEVQEGEVILRLDDGRTQRLVAGESWTRAPAKDGPPPRTTPPSAAPPAEDAAGASFRRGLARYDAQDWAAARVHFNAVATGPLAEDARFWAAMARVHLARDAGAVVALHDALAQGVPPEREGALACVLGLLLTELGRAEEAAPHLQRAAIDADPAVRGCGGP